MLGLTLFEQEILLLIHDEPVLQHEHYFLMHIPAAEISLQGLTPLEQRVLRADRWWAMDELERTTEDVFPAGLSTMLREALARA